MKISLKQLKQLINEEINAANPAALFGVQSAATAVRNAEKWTTFSQWYKGDHGRALSTLKREVKLAIKDLKASGNVEVAQLLKEFLDSLMMRSTSWYLLDQATKAMAKSVTESMDDPSKYFKDDEIGTRTLANPDNSGDYCMNCSEQLDERGECPVCWPEEERDEFDF